VSDLHKRLRRDLTDALRARDRAAVRVLRTALSAIANAEAQPDLGDTPTSLLSDGPIAGAAAGVGSSEVARRTLDDRDMRSILESERAECLATARELAARGAQLQVDALRADAAVLDQYIDS
jgi:uncharacterized protein